MPNKSSKPLSLKDALEKMAAFCAYQERSHRQVVDKMWQLGLDEETQGEVITQLIQDDFLNEERFARSFSRGKFRFKKWGKFKIQQYLQQHEVSERNIRLGLSEIDEEEYRATLRGLASKKWESLSGLHPALKKKKAFSHLAGKGFEHFLITETLNEISSE